MFIDNTPASTFKAGRARETESESYKCNAVAKPYRETRCGGSFERGSPLWSKNTVWFRRPNDVAMPLRKAAPVSNLESIAKPSRAPIAPPESVCLVGMFADKRTPNKLGVTPEGDSTVEIATKVEKRFAVFTQKAKQSKEEKAEVAYLRKCEAAETAYRLAERKREIAEKQEEDFSAAKKAARMEWRRNLSRAIRAAVWL
jgi:hypothetical protein